MRHFKCINLFNMHNLETDVLFLYTFTVETIKAQRVVLSFSQRVTEQNSNLCILAPESALLATTLDCLFIWQSASIFLN